MGRWPLLQYCTRERYARFLVKNPLWVIIVIVSLTAASALIAVEWLHMERSSLALFAPDTAEMREYQRFTDEFGEPDDLIIIVEGATAPLRRAFIDRLAQRLEQEPVERIQHVLYRLPIESFMTFLMASDEDLLAIEQAVFDPKDPLNRLMNAPNFESVFEQLAKMMQEGLETETEADNPEAFFETAQIFFHGFGLELQKPEPSGPELLLRWGGQVFEGLSQTDDQGYLVTENGAVHLLFVKPGDAGAEADKAIELVTMVRSEVQELLRDFPDLTVGLTGDPALTYDEFSISERDMTWATLFALAATALIFFISFRSFVHPVLGFACLIMGVTITFGLTTLSIGHLNLISLTFAVILIGLGVQYGVHIIARYEEERGKHQDLEGTVAALMKNTVPSLWVGALTTAVAFYAVALIDFRGFQELAFIAGSGVLICFVVMSFGLPAFLVWYDRRRRRDPATGRSLAPRIRTRWGQFYVSSITRHPRLILMTGLMLSVISLVAYLQWGPRPYFDYNLLNQQAKSAEAVQYMKRLMDTDFSPRFAIYRADDEAEAREVAEKLAGLPAIERVDTIFSLIPEASEQKVDQVRKLGREFQERFRFGNQPAEPKAVVKALGELAQALQAAQEKLFAGGYTDALVFAEGAVKQIRETQNVLKALPADTATRRLNGMQEDIATMVTSFIRSEVERTPIVAEQIPEAIRSRFISEANTYALYVYPSVSVWERDGMQQFVTALRSVSPSFSGPALQMYSALHAMDTGWYLAAAYAALAIFLIFLFDFKNLWWALIACVPLACGVTWIYGGMAIIQLRWNIVNLIALPLVMGIGADCGIHLIHRYREHKKRDVSFVLSSTGKAVTVAYSETLVSFLGLAVAHHQGLASLGKVIIWGVFCCYLAGMIILPALLTAWPLKEARPEETAA